MRTVGGQVMSDRAIDKVKATKEERGKDYEGKLGPKHGAKQLGRMWAALLSESMLVEVPDIPPHIVLLMMAQLKVSRAARPYSFKQDNYIDGIAYFDLAEEVITDNHLFSAPQVPTGCGLRPSAGLPAAGS